MKWTAIICFGVALATLRLSSARAEVVDADPSNYRRLLGSLEPGDTLLLSPGRYPRLTLRDLTGTADAWITISGPSSGDPAIIESDSCCNTVQLYGSSFVVIQNLSIDVGGLFVDAINAKDDISHDIRIDSNTMFNFPDDQLIVGINTKSTAWNWNIRGNRIIGAGTGIYLGGSGGDSPFINGVIENNLIVNPMGYCLQIKHQNRYVVLDGMPSGPSRTIIRNNVLIKNDRPSPAGDRPNLLVSGFPDSGPGSMDHYQIYGNFIFYNPRESLFQGAGRIRMHDNIFVGGGGTQTAVLLTPHQGKVVRVADIYNNTVYDVVRGIRLTSTPTESSRVVGNIVFADEPISGPFEDDRDNLTDSVENAGIYVASPSTALGEMDFFPRGEWVQGSPLDLSAFSGDVDYDRDFNGASKEDFSFRGAYAGEGENPGWSLAGEFKGAPVSARPDAGVSDLDGGDLGDGGIDRDGSTSRPNAGAEVPSPPGAGGCSTSGHSSGVGVWGNALWLLAGLLWCGRRRSVRGRWSSLGLGLALGLPFAVALPATAMASPLSDLAATVEPGSFAELEIDGSITTCDAMVPPSSVRDSALGNILEFTDEALWDPAARQIYIMGERRPYQAEDKQFVRYSEASNSWEILDRPPFNTGFHAYDHGAIDPVRRVYYRAMTGTPLRVWAMDIPTGMWRELPRVPVGRVGQIVSIEFFPELDRLVYFGASDSVPGVTQYATYDFDSDRWEASTFDDAPIGMMSSFSEYNQYRGLMYFGGGHHWSNGGTIPDPTPSVNESRRLYMLGRDERVTRLANAPSYLGQSGTGPVQTIDPNTGNLVVFPGGREGGSCAPNPRPIYEYAHDDDTWRQTGTQTLGNRWCAMDTAAVPLYDYGVIFVVSVRSDTDCRVFLYRHSPGTGPGFDGGVPDEDAGVAIDGGTGMQARDAGARDAGARDAGARDAAPQDASLDREAVGPPESPGCQCGAAQRSGSSGTGLLWVVGLVWVRRLWRS